MLQNNFVNEKSLSFDWLSVLVAVEPQISDLQEGCKHSLFKLVAQNNRTINAATQPFGP
jgi:hypothetical protein